MQLHQPEDVVRFAISAHLDAYRWDPENLRSRHAGGSTGRIEFARRLKRTQAWVSMKLSSDVSRGGPKGIAEIATKMEFHGMAPPRTVTRLAGRVRLLPEKPTVEGRWWPLLRDRHRLGVEGGPKFENSFEVLMAAEAFVDRYAALVRAPPTKMSESKLLSPRDHLSCEQLLEMLCGLASGPYGVASDALQLVAFLAPLSPLTVTAFIRRGVLTTQVIRALDRSLRLAEFTAADALADEELADDVTPEKARSDETFGMEHGVESMVAPEASTPGRYMVPTTVVADPPEVGWNGSMRGAYSELLSKPPQKIFRRTNWMRALRRLRLTDYRLNPRRVKDDPNFRWWIFEQLEKAMRGEEAYSGARATDRRYAFWCLAELTISDSRWESVCNEAERDDEIRPLLEQAEELRRYTTQFEEPNAFAFDPAQEHGAALLRKHKRLQDLLIGDEFRPRDPVMSVWRWASNSRKDALTLLRNALFDPDVIKQRSSTDALGFSGEATRQSVAETIAALLEELRRWDHGAPLYLVERALAILGMMGRRSAIPVVEKYVRERDDETLTQAVATAGDLAHLHPDECWGLSAWTVRAVERHLNEEDVVIAGIYALVASRKDPRAALRDVSNSTSRAVQLSLAWADAVATDPLSGSLPARGEHGYPASHQG